jgi:glycolate oxidase FAD binding subunit
MIPRCQARARPLFGEGCDAVRTIDAQIEAEAVLGLRSTPRWHTPASTGELAALLAEARARGQAVVPWGGGTEQDLGAPPCRADLIVHTRGIGGIIAYAPEDLTLSVRAGTTLEEIRDALAAHRQFLPLDLPRPERATIGGVVATAAVPVRRFRYGGARDLVIGLEAALPDGTLCKSGGRVVKNVAGYDLCKLFTGSLGTLGVITVVNLKVQPLPSRQAALQGRFDEAGAALRAGAALAATSLGFGALILSHATDGPWLLDVLAEGFAGSVARQTEAAGEAIVREGGYLAARAEGAAAQEVIAQLAHWRVLNGDADLLLRGSVAPGRLAAALHAADRALGDLAARAVQADAGTGTFFVRGGLAPASTEATAAAIIEARGAVAACSGSLVLAGGPASLRAACDPWGAPPQAEHLARAIKEKIDPDGVLNPGRFSYGI